MLGCLHETGRNRFLHGGAVFQGVFPQNDVHFFMGQFSWTDPKRVIDEKRVFAGDTDIRQALQKSLFIRYDASQREPDAFYRLSAGEGGPGRGGRGPAMLQRLVGLKGRHLTGPSQKEGRIHLECR